MKTTLHVKYDRHDQIVEGFKDGIRAAVRAAGFTAQGMTAARVPVRTGALKNSVSTEILESATSITAIVSSNLHYAPYVEFGTRYMAAQPAWIPVYATVSKGLLRTLAHLEAMR